MIFVSERFDASPDNANWFSCGDAGFSGCSGPAAMQAEATFPDWSNEGHPQLEPEGKTGACSRS